MTTHTFATHYGDDDTPVTITYTYTPACLATLEDPGNDADITIYTIECAVIVDEDWLLEKAWEHYPGQQP